VVFKLWQMPNDMKTQYIEFLEESDEQEHLGYPGLRSEIVEISRDLDLDWW